MPKRFQSLYAYGLSAYLLCVCICGCTVYTGVCLCEPDLGEAVLVDMVHHHYFIVITGWRAPRAAERQTQCRALLHNTIRKPKSEAMREIQYGRWNSEYLKKK